MGFVLMNKDERTLTKIKPVVFNWDYQWTSPVVGKNYFTCISGYQDTGIGEYFWIWMVLHYPAQIQCAIWCLLLDPVSFQRADGTYNQMIFAQFHLAQLCPFLDQESQLSVTRLITSQLHYWNIFHVRLLLKTTLKSQIVHDAVAWICLAYFSTPINPTNHLHCLLTSFQIQFRMLLPVKVYRG